MTDRLATVVFSSYGDTDPTKDEVEHALDVVLTRHNSVYRGGDYWLRDGGSEDETIIVQPNADENEPVEPVNMPTIVYVERTRRPSEVRQRLGRAAGLVFVRQDDWPES